MDEVYTDALDVSVLAAILARLAAPGAEGPAGDGWCFDMTKAPREAIICTEQWSVTEGLKFNSGRWGIATFNGTKKHAEPYAWRPLPAPPSAPSGETP